MVPQNDDQMLSYIAEKDKALLGCPDDEIVNNLKPRLSQGILGNTSQNIALVYRQRQFTYAELVAAVEVCKAQLLSLGVRPGDRVMLVCENSPAAIFLILALSELDGIAVVINARLSNRERRLIEADCMPRRVIYTLDESETIKVLAKSNPQLKGFKELEFSFGRVAVGDLQMQESTAVSTDTSERVLAMIYTTGTTGAPKGVMLSQCNLTFMAFVSAKLRGLRDSDRIYCALPISHVFGLSAVCFSALTAGACLHIVPRFDAVEVRRALQLDGITGFFGVPTMYNLLLEGMHPNWQAPQLRFTFAGGSPLDAGLKQQVEARFGTVLHNGYGLTETAPTICQTRLYAPLDNCSVGYALPGIKVRIVDEDQHDVAVGGVGELWVKGPNVMLGYYRKPALTHAVLNPDGWFNTGDLVYQDSAGAIHVAGRTKELIIRSGFNVYPPEVEAVISSHPDVSFCAVVGKSVLGDEEIVAFVQLRNVRDDIEPVIIEYARSKLTAYKVPSRIVVLSEMPTAPSGKILKHQLERLLDKN